MKKLRVINNWTDFDKIKVGETVRLGPKLKFVFVKDKNKLSGKKVKKIDARSFEQQLNVYCEVK